MPALGPSRARRLGAAAATAAAGLVLALGVPADAATPASVGTPTVLPGRDAEPSPLIERGSYDYAPSVLWDAKAELYRMWWCGGLADDHVSTRSRRRSPGRCHPHRLRAGRTLTG